MAFRDRISGMFRFGAKGRSAATGAGERSGEAAPRNPQESMTRAETRRDSEDEDAATEVGGSVAEALPATREEREELIQEIGRGFVHVGETIDRLDRNLDQGVRSLESLAESQRRVPDLILEQQHLIRASVEQGAAARDALQQLARHLADRDQAQHAIADRLEQLATGMREQRDQHHRDLDLLMTVQRSNRTLTILFFLGGLLLILILLAAILAIALRSELLGGAGPQTTAAPEPAAAAITTSGTEAQEARPIAAAITEPGPVPIIESEPASIAERVVARDHAERRARIEAATASDDPLVAATASRILAARSQQ